MSSPPFFPFEELSREGVMLSLRVQQSFHDRELWGSIQRMSVLLIHKEDWVLKAY